jgi:hypothetical protein
MRQANSQLTASLAAAEKRCDAAQLMVQGLRSNAKAAEARLVQLQQLPGSTQPLASVTDVTTSRPAQNSLQAAAATPDGGNDQGTGPVAVAPGFKSTPAWSSVSPSPAHDLAKVTAQLAVAVREAREASGQVATLTLVSGI